jgi:hypothetical protein
MPETPNHGYNVPDEGTQNWHEPLNENFEAYDTDIEVRDEEANLGDYEPKEGAKFLATDSGAVYLGTGSRWRPIRSTGSNPAFEYLYASSGVRAGSTLSVQNEADLTSQVVYYTGPQSGGTARAYLEFDDNADQWRLRMFNDGGSDFPALTAMRDGSKHVGLGTDEPAVPLDVRGRNNWNLDSDDGDLRIGNDDYRLTMGVALGGGGAGACNIRAKGGIQQLQLGAGDSGNTLSIEPDTATVDGDLDVNGNKNFVQSVDTDAGEREVVYTATEAGTPHTEASGVAELEDGRAGVDLPDHFGWVTDADEPLMVQTTPYGGSTGLKVVERSTERIVVEDLDGEGDYEFAYTVKGTREGHAEKRVVREPSATATDGPAPADD